MHPAQLPVDDLLASCQCRRQRRSGPGGQHRNKVETGIFLKHVPTGVEVSATEERSQEKNRLQAIGRLRIALAIHVRSESESASSPTPLWNSRCQGGRLVISPSHNDYPAILAEAMDALAGAEFDLPRAAQRLGCTASQLVKLLKKEPQAFTCVNRSREERGLGRLK
ncbi:MAG: peptide chain release factor-like protein [Planctomycetales bacterium]|nr:peptide chain release factor-like protein [Planctomycetales bacterium]